MGLGLTLHTQGMKTLLPWTACASHSPKVRLSLRLFQVAKSCVAALGSWLGQDWNRELPALSPATHLRQTRNAC